MMIPKKILMAIGGSAVLLASTMVTYFEGLSHKPYKDRGDVLTVCYGHTGKAIIPGKHYTDEECQALLDSDLKASMAVVETHVTVPLTEMQKAALASFVYNVGSGAFARSTLLKKLNVGDRQGACDEMRRWKYDEGKVSKGLINRRAVERELCLPD
ncbi:Lysozyme [Bacteriophage APSE-2]|uniref:Lysozyme n=1 Tax=Bacteriophage APSE-2 TaxID=340054 RepID=A0A6F9EY16_9CAUD|nr:Lysozyme [Bacteriophage APSE-2]